MKHTKAYPLRSRGNTACRWGPHLVLQLHAAPPKSLTLGLSLSLTMADTGKDLTDLEAG